MTKMTREAALAEYMPMVTQHTGPAFKRPVWTHDDTLYSEGWYWENADADRFYFNTQTEAALDLATDCGDYAGMIA